MGTAPSTRRAAPSPGPASDKDRRASVSDVTEHWKGLDKDEAISSDALFEFLVAMAHLYGVEAPPMCQYLYFLDKTTKLGARLRCLLIDLTFKGGPFLFHDVVLIYFAFARKFHLPMAANFPPEVLRIQNEAPKRLPENFLAGANNLGKYNTVLAEVAKNLPADCYLQLLPAELLNLVWQYMESGGIFGAADLHKRWEHGGFYFRNEDLRIIQNGHCMAHAEEHGLYIYSPKKFKRVVFLAGINIKTGKVTWRSTELSLASELFSELECIKTCATTCGDLFVSSRTGVIEIFRPPLRNSVQKFKLELADTPAICALRDDVYTMQGNAISIMQRGAGGTWQAPQRIVAVMKELQGWFIQRLSVHSTEKHGDIVIVAMSEPGRTYVPNPTPPKYRVVMIFLATKVAHVLKTHYAQFALCRSSLVYYRKGIIYVRSLDTGLPEIAKHDIEASESPPGQAVTVKQADHGHVGCLAASFQSMRFFLLNVLTVLWLLRGNVLLTSENNDLKWYSLSSRSELGVMTQVTTTLLTVRLAKDLLDADPFEDMIVLGDDFLTTGNYRLVCWEVHKEGKLLTAA